jgi:hypothetical protein
MVRRLFENLLATYILSSALSAIAAYNLYSLYFDYGVVFDLPVIDFVEHVLYLNLTLFGLSLLVLVTAVRSVWNNLLLRLIINYYAPVIVTLYYLYMGLINGLSVEGSVPNFITLIFYILIYTIFYRRRGRKFVVR